MIHLSLDGAAQQILRLGAHFDDIGFGGTILRSAEGHPDTVFRWIVFKRHRRAGAGCSMWVLRRSTVAGTRAEDLPPRLYACGHVKDVFTVSSDLVFTHKRKGAHQDHRLLAELTWNTFRAHLILKHEIPRCEGELGKPRLFIPLPVELCQRKVSYIINAFPSQRQKHWFQEDTFFSLMRLREMECQCAQGVPRGFLLAETVLHTRTSAHQKDSTRIIRR